MMGTKILHLKCCTGYKCPGVVLNEQEDDDPFTEQSMEHYREWERKMEGSGADLKVSKRDGQTSNPNSKGKAKYRHERKRNSTTSNRAPSGSKRKSRGSSLEIDMRDRYEEGIDIGFEIFRSYAKLMAPSDIWDKIDVETAKVQAFFIR